MMEHLILYNLSNNFIMVIRQEKDGISKKYPCIFKLGNLNLLSIKWLINNLKKVL